MQRWPFTRSYTAFAGTHAALWVTALCSQSSLSASLPQSLFGIHVSYEISMAVAGLILAAIPFTGIALLLLTIKAAAHAVARAMQAKPVPGICVRCGYDLRATPLRCPECGEVNIRNWQGSAVKCMILKHRTGMKQQEAEGTLHYD